MRENRQTKIKLILNCEMVRQALISGNTETIIAHFRTKTAVNLEGNDDADELRMFLEPMEEGIFNFNQRGATGDFKEWLILKLIWLNMIRRAVHRTSSFPNNWMAKKRSSTWKTKTNNQISMNVFGFESKVYPLRLGKKKFVPVVNLLSIS